MQKHLLPKERQQAVLHLKLIVGIARQIPFQEFLLFENSPHSCGHQKEDAEQSPTRAERERYAQKDNKSSHIHRVAHKRVQSRRYDFLLGKDFDGCRGKAIFSVNKKYDEKPERDQKISRYRQTKRPR